MGYHVMPAGRLHLPEAEDANAVTAVRAAWAALVDGFDPESVPPTDTLADIADDAAAAVTRDGDWIEFAHDDAGDPKWSARATAFYVAIAPFVRSPGTVRFHGEDGAQWSYSYADGQITQHGWNGWDGSIEPFGEYVDPPGSQ